MGTPSRRTRWPATTASGGVSFSVMGLSAETFDMTRRGFRDGLSQLVRLAALAEECGLDGVFVTEHHLVREGHLAAPWVVLGAIAQATERVRLGTNVALAPLYHPVRLAEDVAAVDLLSGGRAVVALGIGYRPEEFALFGVDRRQRARALEDSVRVMRAGWGGDLPPLPFQDPGPPIWIGAFAEPGVRRARRIGDGYLAPTLSLPALMKRVGWLREEGSLLGFDVGVSLNGFVGAGDAWATVSEHLMWTERRYKRWQVEAADLPSAVDMQAQHQALERPPHLVVGNPREVVEQLRPWVEALSSLPGGARGHIQLRVTYPGMAPRDAREAIRLLGSEVVPALRERRVPTPVGS